MISLITCSRSHDVSEELRQNVAATIGTEYEWIVVDNTSNDHSIFSAYNEGVSRSSGNVLCFMHDDILYNTHGWGAKVEKHFGDPSVGLIGVAGGKYLPNMPCTWFQSSSDRCVNIKQHIDDEERLDYLNPDGTERSEVVAVDGVWFCIRKELFEKISFDESYGGFHMYDMDICMQVRNEGYKNYVVYDVLIEHMSIGNAKRDWMNAALAFWRKWESKLPQYTKDFLWTPKRKKDCWRMLYNELLLMQKCGFSSADVMSIARSVVGGMPRTISKYQCHIYKMLLASK